MTLTFCPSDCFIPYDTMPIRDKTLLELHRMIGESEIPALLVRIVACHSKTHDQVTIWPEQDEKFDKMLAAHAQFIDVLQLITTLLIQPGVWDRHVYETRHVSRSGRCMYVAPLKT